MNSGASGLNRRLGSSRLVFSGVSTIVGSYTVVRSLSFRLSAFFNLGFSASKVGPMGLSDRLDDGFDVLEMVLSCRERLLVILLFSGMGRLLVPGLGIGKSSILGVGRGTVGEELLSLEDFLVC